MRFPHPVEVDRGWCARSTRPSSGACLGRRRSHVDHRIAVSTGPRWTHDSPATPFYGLVSFEADKKRRVVLGRPRWIRRRCSVSGAFVSSGSPRQRSPARSTTFLARDRRCARDGSARTPLARSTVSFRSAAAASDDYERAQDVALAAAFLHDVGHGPLSHLFEDAIPGTAHHEECTEKIVLDPSTGVNGVLDARSSSMPERVAAPRSWQSTSCLYLRAR